MYTPLVLNVPSTLGADHGHYMIQTPSHKKKTESFERQKLLASFLEGGYERGLLGGACGGEVEAAAVGEVRLEGQVRQGSHLCRHTRASIVILVTG